VTAPDVRGPHGTNAGYQAHIKYKTPLCEPCKAAHMAADRRTRDSKRSPEIHQLELERLRPGLPPLDPVAETWRRLLDLIAGECRRAGMLP
jgi:hypothetical protein